RSGVFRVVVDGGVVDYAYSRRLKLSGYLFAHGAHRLVKLGRSGGKLAVVSVTGVRLVALGCVGVHYQHLRLAVQLYFKVRLYFRLLQKVVCILVGAVSEHAAAREVYKRRGLLIGIRLSYYLPAVR